MTSVAAYFFSRGFFLEFLSSFLSMAAAVMSYLGNAWKEATKDEERVFFVVSMMWAITGTFWFMNLVFFLLDRSGIFEKYKVIY